jgi:pyruvate dehydrogenase (quinone)
MRSTGGFAAVADAYLTGDPVAICGTAGPGVTHLINAMIDARREGAPIIVIAGDVESAIIDTSALEELNPYHLFQTASLYTGRIVNPHQVRAVVQTALRTALADRGPTVISLPGDVAVASVSGALDPIARVNAPIVRPDDGDLRRLAAMVDGAERVTIFGGDGCRDAHDEVVALAQKLKAPVGYACRGKQCLEHDNPNAVSMSGLIGFGGAHRAMHEADLLLLLGTDFPFSEFLPDRSVKKVQIDREAKHLGRRTPIDLGLVGNIKDTVAALFPLVAEKTATKHLDRALATTREWQDSLAEYVDRGPSLTPIRPEYLVATLDRLADDDAFFRRRYGNAVHLGRALHPRERKAKHLRFVHLGVDGERRAERDGSADGVSGPPNDRIER